LRQAQAGDREDLIQPLDKTARNAGHLLLQAAGEIEE
jgi:hypothetical protein